jgi:charged multivesicular body protein 2A
MLLGRPPFTRPPARAELLRENKRMIDRAIRDLDRERMGLQAQEKKMVLEIKKMAKDNQMEAVKVMARSVVRNRTAVTKLYGLKSQLQAVSLRMAELKSTQAMSDAMRGTTKAMAAMNRRMNLPAVAKIMREFERQNAKMEMTGDMMGDAMDMAFEGEGEEAESDELVNQVLDEIGVDTGAAMAKVPAGAVPAQAAAAAEAAPMPQAVGADGGGGAGGGGGGGPGLTDDLLAKLQELRRP